MKCKYCSAELEENQSVCPACGRDNDAPEETTEMEAAVAEEETPAEAAVTEEANEEAEKTEEPAKSTGISGGKLALVIVAGIALLAVLICVIVMGMNGGRGDSAGASDTTAAPDTQASTAATEAATIPTDGNPEDTTCKGSYTASDEDVRAAMNMAVATFGENELTNGELQIYYWSQIYSFYQYYGSYASALGLDHTKPLDTQLNPEGITWQQAFLGMALEAWQTDRALADQALAQNLTLDDESAAELASMRDDLEAQAQENGFANAQEMLEKSFGAGCTLDDYVKYVELYCYRSLYYMTTTEQLNPTDAEVDAYFAEHETDYAASGLTKETKHIDVHHILIKPEGGTTDENGTTTYSDAEWENCRAAAQAILDEWLTGEQTEESFAALANQHSTDPGSNTNGGLYEDVAEGDMVEEFNDWCFDEARAAGDTGLVKTRFGYHVMFFVDNTYPWFDQAKNDLIQSLKSKIISDAMASSTLEVDYSKILLGYVDLAA